MEPMSFMKVLLMFRALVSQCKRNFKLSRNSIAVISHIVFFSVVQARCARTIFMKGV